MKRALLLLLVLVALVLAACGNDKDESSEPADETTQEPDQSEESGESETNTSEADEANENETDDEDASESEKADDEESGEIDHSAIEDFEEFDVIADNIDLNSYKSILETDNKGNRIILFEDASGEKEFKSVFVKNDKRLKIIKLKDDGLLFNEIID